MGDAPKREDFHLGAEVRSSDGKSVGELKRVLVTGDDYALKALIVKEGGLFSGLLLAPGAALLADEVIVPMDAVGRVTRAGVELKLSSADVRALPPYISFRSGGESIVDELEETAAVLGQSPVIPREFQEIANKAADELEIEGGENVMLGRTGKVLGHVKDVLFDDGALVGIVVQPEGWFKTDVLLQRRFLDRSDDAALFARLTEDEIKALPRFAGEGG